ncbi:MAG: hypothetical protein K1Y36_25145 [Blastocatellia bacterium]|nr:hypothetical protein [Blastocatellia bacterium]
MSQTAHPVSSDSIVTRLHDFLTQLIVHGGFDLYVSVKAEDPHTFSANFTGDDVALLLGRNAELLNTLEYLAGRIIGDTAKSELRLKFDAGNYRLLRERELHMMAETAAERAKRYQKPFTLNPMSSAERRIIHLVLSQDPTVRTESIGDGEERKVVIHPV